MSFRLEPVVVVVIVVVVVVVVSALRDSMTV